MQGVLLSLLVGLCACYAAVAPFNAHDLLTLAGQQLMTTMKTAASVTSYPDAAQYSDKFGMYVYSPTPYNSWTSGFFPGELWLISNYTKNADFDWKSAAQEWTAGIQPEEFDKSTHDVGFMVFYSFGRGYLVSGDPQYKNVTLTAAQSLSTRFNPTVGCIRSWPGYHFPVIIDNMMNLELLFWSALNGGEQSWLDMAISHADKTLVNHIRPAGNSWHLVDYDPATGDVLSVCNCPQGLDQVNGTWSRGQAWAIYGFTIAYRYTKLERYLQMAQKTSDWFLAHLPSDSVPYWDFAAPGQSRDSSAASIAASGLIELSTYLQTSNSSASEYYLNSAYTILASLSSPAYLSDPTYSEAILLQGTGGQGSLMNYSLIFGDYYYVEALIKSLYI